MDREVTKEEKTRRINRLEKRLKRFGEWVDYYKPTNHIKLISCAVKARVMATELVMLASQPTND